MELKGTITKISEIQTFASGFQKREMVLTTEEQYPQPINIEFLQDKIDLLDKVNEGDAVTVGINIRGREWTSPQGEVKYFNSITGWKVTKDAGAAPTPEPIQAAAPRANPAAVTPTPVADTPEIFAEEDDDLPF